ncbi:MAG: gluconate 2-dehydrogenase subunit 3 family protein [Tannerellaceae bacterium]|jgi:gluconate 2-dehydrogenase gamma chain|nr:gluconate 2-dehydrogenase subunit 3 family protein [Tannerellaceae bacterium]
MKYNRRNFIKQCIALYGSTLLLPACSTRGKTQTYRSFSPLQADCLGAICEQIIPTDEYPGAIDSGVVNYIDRQIYIRFPELKELYHEGIQAVNSYCTSVYNKEFTALSWDDQTQLLLTMEKGELPEEHWEKASQREFFRIVRRNTMQGFYGAPHHGGNKDYISYRMMNLNYPFIAGQNRYGEK